MSSHRETRRSERSAWSDWAWDSSQNQWYRTQLDSRGNYIYDTRQHDTTHSPQIPRESDTLPGLPNQTGNVTYHTNDLYKYSTVGALTSSLERTTISTPITTYPPTFAENVAVSTFANDIAPSTVHSGTLPIPIASSVNTHDTTASYRGYGQSQGSAAHSSFGGSYQDQVPATGSYDSSYDQNFPSHSYGSDATIRPQTGGSFAPSSSYTPTYGEARRSGSVTPQPTPHKHITGTEGKEEKLDARFRVHNSKYFKPGHVFKVLWSEPEGENRSAATDVTEYTLEKTRFGEKVHSTVRRFVIVAADEGHCQCLPILTYRRQGTLKPGVKGKDHAVIYMTANSKEEPPAEYRGENLDKAPIRVNPKTPRDKLEPESRINYAKIYTVEHNVKVWFIGQISKNSQRRLMTDFDATWMQKRQMNPD